MEGLVIIIGELLFFLLAPAFAMLAGILGAVLEFLLAIFGAVFRALFSGSKKDTRKQRPAPDTAPAKPRKRTGRRWLHGIAAVGGVAVLAVVVVNFLFLAPVLRWGLGQVEDRTGYAVSFETAEGNLFTGTLAMTGLRVSREGPPGLGMDVSVDAAAVDVAMTSLLSETVRVEELAVAGVAGRIATPHKSETTDQPEPAPKPRRDFVVERASIAGVDLDVAPADGRPHQVQIASASAEPFRSRTALFDLMFRSNLDARINGIPLVVETEVISERGRRTRWAFQDVPVATLADLTDRAPVRWLSGGTVTTLVEDEWDLTETGIDMDWQIAMSGVEASAPRGAGAAERLLATAFAKAVDRSGGDADFAFTLTLDRDGLEAAGSDDLSALWDALRDGVAGAIAARADAEAEEVSDGIQNARDRLFDLLDRDRGE